MSRSGLWRFLLRRCAIGRAARARGRPLDEALEQAMLTRRGLLRLGAGTGLALGGFGCPSPAPTRRGPAIAIVGAGIAGLTCGFQLLRAGLDVKVFDAQPRVGGRIHSSRWQLGGGLVAELGGELIGPEHVAIRGLCHAFGLLLDDACEDPADTASTLYFDGQRRSSVEIAEAFTPIADAIARELARVGTFAIDHRTPAAASLDAQSLAQWLDGTGTSGWFRALLDVASTTEYGLDPGEQSALTFLTMFAAVEPRSFDPTFAGAQRFHVRGGNDLVTERLAEHLGGKLELESQLEALRRAAGGYVLTFRRSGRARDVRADIVVLALPFTTLRDVALEVPLSATKRHAIAELGYGTNAKLLAGFAQRPWRSAGDSGTVLTDLRFQSLWDATRRQPGDAGILVSLTGGREGLAIGDGDARDQAAALASAIDAIFPGAAAVHTGAARFHWPSFAWTKGSYACWRPGQRAAFGGVEAEPAERIFFAGEHTARVHFGFMEGACESGARAADEVLVALGRPPVPLPAPPGQPARLAPCEPRFIGSTR